MRDNMGKYRGKDYGGKWNYGSLVLEQYHGEQQAYITNTIASMSAYVYVDPSTAGECTGLPDKNGKEIYEGDILGGLSELVTIRGVPTGHFADSRHVVEWDNEKTGFITRQIYESRDPKFYAERRVIGALCITAKYHPIIGNIHDNPELMEG